MSELFCWYPGIINNKLNRNCTYYKAAFFCRGSGDMYKPHELYSRGLSMSLIPLYKSKERRCSGEGWNLHGASSVFCLHLFPHYLTSLAHVFAGACLGMNELLQKRNSSCEKCLFWVIGTIWEIFCWKIEGKLNSSGKPSRGDVYLWLIKNDNLYFVCVIFFLGLLIISSVRS